MPKSEIEKRKRNGDIFCKRNCEKSRTISLVWRRQGEIKKSPVGLLKKIDGWNVKKNKDKSLILEVLRIFPKENDIDFIIESSLDGSIPVLNFSA